MIHKDIFCSRKNGNIGYTATTLTTRLANPDLSDFAGLSKTDFSDFETNPDLSDFTVFVLDSDFSDFETDSDFSDFEQKQKSRHCGGSESR